MDKSHCKDRVIIPHHHHRHHLRHDENMTNLIVIMTIIMIVDTDLIVTEIEMNVQSLMIVPDNLISHVTNTFTHCESHVFDHL